MQVTVHQTPNPNARKFVVAGHRFAQPLNFPSADAAALHPLASRLFALPGVYNVFHVADFVTVNKLPDVAWDELEATAAGVIESFLAGDMQE